MDYYSAKIIAEKCSAELNLVLVFQILCHLMMYLFLAMNTNFERLSRYQCLFRFVRILAYKFIKGFIYKTLVSIFFTQQNLVQMISLHKIFMSLLIHMLSIEKSPHE